MNIFILNKNFVKIDLVDNFESFIWTERYSDCGDFELYMLADSRYKNTLVVDNYVQIPVSDNLMIIEHITTSFDAQTGYHMSIKGRSLESILMRRIIYPQLTYGEYDDTTQVITRFHIQTIIHDLFDKFILNKIPNFIFKTTNNSNIAQMQINKQFLGNSVFEAIQGICNICQIGFKVHLVNNQFVFEMYDGYDRSFDQTSFVNDPVMFSPSLNNLVSSDYEESTADFHNAAVIAGDSGDEPRFISVTDTINVTGLDRREMYVDSGGTKSSYAIPEDSPTGTEAIPIPAELYAELLLAKGYEELTKTLKYKKFFMRSR